MWWSAGMNRHGFEDERALREGLAIHSAPSFVLRTVRCPDTDESFEQKRETAGGG